MKKKMMSVLCALLAVFFCASGAAGCKEQTIDTDQHLEIYVLNVGYGYEWAEELAKAFSQKDWVKAKYPEFSYKVNYNDDWDFAAERIKAGGTVNTADILFGSSLQKLYNTTLGGQPVLTDLGDLMEETVMGEEIVYQDKIYPDFLKTNVNPDTGTAIAVPWGTSYNTLIYNETLFNALGFEEIPVTTKEFVDILKAVKNRVPDDTYSYSHAIIGCYNVNYWKNAYTLWWAQYQGVQGYTDFYNGVSEGKLSRDIFRQLGRLRSLEAMDEILDGRNAYIDPSSGVYEFMEAQTNFLMGNGIFYMCGDWFDYEMRAISPGLQELYPYTMRAMRMPVLSSVRENTGIASDEIMADLIREIDEGKSYDELENVNVSETDYDTVKAARSLNDFGGGILNAVVPSYATAKDLALDFLRYFATDEANEIYASVTKGASTGFIYDLETKAPDVFAEISPVERDKFTVMNGENLEFLPNQDIFPLVYKGGLLPLKAIEYNSYENVFGRTDGTRQSAQDLYDYDIEYYSGSRWDLLVSMSGIQI